MEKKHACITFFFFFFFLNIIIPINSKGSGDGIKRKLYVFGDSYADTGNWPSSSWKKPYGVTFPGKPTGRFSDGRVLTDFIASYIGIRSPLPYKQWRNNNNNINVVGEKPERFYGMNFAHGGTGVFTTLVNQPNMSTQIDLFQQFLQQQLYDIDSSIALVSLGGNDYATYLAKNGNNLEELPAFTQSVVNQLVFNLKRIAELGVKRVAVTAIEPMGCLPQMTNSLSYKNCSEMENTLSEFHNDLLQQVVSNLNSETQNNANFVILDLYNAFLANIDTQRNTKEEEILKPCCVGSCGNMGKNGERVRGV